MMGRTPRTSVTLAEGSGERVTLVNWSVMEAGTPLLDAALHGPQPIEHPRASRRWRTIRRPSFPIGALLLSPLLLAAAQAPSARISDGMIQGLLVDGLEVFRGVPYAAPPVGDLRWSPPQPVDGWPGVLRANSFGPQCMQRPYASGSVWEAPPRPTSEDCLYLNIMSGKGEQLPVMVWIHGGSWTRGTGASETYQGSALARRGVVVVTINYRLGPFGFFAHPGLSAESEMDVSGNQGILDQIAALEWVRDNIAAFRGDPDRVTIFGESAGSWAVHTLVASPLAKGLFHGAIGESGGQFGAQIPLRAEDGASVTEDSASAERAGEVFADIAGAASIAELRSLSAERLMTVWGTTDGRKLPISVNVDGYVLEHDVTATFAQNLQSDVPVLIGSNSDEATAFLPPMALPRTVAVLRQRLSLLAGESTEDLLEAYGVVDDEDAAGAMLAAWRDQVFTVQMRRWARATAEAGQHAYLYYFTRKPPGVGRLGAYHSSEIRYVFGSLGENSTPLDHELSDTMANYWTNFAKTGDPNGDHHAQWKPWDNLTRSYMELGDKVGSGTRLLDRELDALERAFSGGW